MDRARKLGNMVNGAGFSGRGASVVNVKIRVVPPVKVHG